MPDDSYRAAHQIIGVPPVSTGSYVAAICCAVNASVGPERFPVVQICLGFFQAFEALPS